MEGKISHSFCSVAVKIIFSFAFRTIVAVAGEDFAIIASDTRLIQGYSILTREQPKLFKLSDQTVLGVSGCWCDVLTFTRTLEARMKVDFACIIFEINY